MNYAEIKKYDIANGTGVRVSLFVSGCTHACPGCFNAVAQNFKYGRPFTEQVEDMIIESCEPFYISGLTLLGGEPFEPENIEAVTRLMRRFRRTYPEKDIWCYSGYTYEQLSGAVACRVPTTAAARMLELIDVLVDGEFVEELKDISLRFRGSSNQRLIDMNATRQHNEVVLWNGTDRETV